MDYEVKNTPKTLLEMSVFNAVLFSYTRDRIPFRNIAPEILFESDLKYPRMACDLAPFVDAFDMGTKSFLLVFMLLRGVSEL